MAEESISTSGRKIKNKRDPYFVYETPRARPYEVELNNTEHSRGRTEKCSNNGESGQNSVDTEAFVANTLNPALVTHCFTLRRT